MLRILFIDGRLTEGASRELYNRQRQSQTAATPSPCHLQAKVQKINPSHLLGPICSGPESSCWKSVRLRIGSQTGSIFKPATDAVPPAGIESKRRSLLMASPG